MMTPGPLPCRLVFAVGKVFILERSAKTPGHYPGVMVTLGVVLIHNGDADRIHTATEAIDQFSSHAKGVLDVARGQVSYQAPITPASIGQSLIAWWLSVTGDHRWGHYLSPSESLAERQRRARHTLALALKKLRKTLRRRKRVTVAAVVSAKNIRAWQRMVDEGWDYLLAVEDDVVLAAGAEKEIAAVLAELSSRERSDLLFASLAKAVTIEQLGARELITEQTENLTWFSRPVSNTAAAYLLSRSLAEAFLEELTRHRVLTVNPADWILNHLFMRFERRGISISCFHTKEGIFVNRSILGELPSQTRV